MGVQNKPVELEEIPGFYYIPGFDRFAVSMVGGVIDVRSRTMVKPSVYPSGYVYYSLPDCMGDSRMVARHRLLGIIFKHPGSDVKRLVVNHLNGIKGDDRLDNLEWATYKGNLEHAGWLGLTDRCFPIEVRDVDSREVKVYSSAVECGRALELSRDAVYWRLGKGERHIAPERKQYRRYESFDRPWDEPENIEHSVLDNGTAKVVLVKKLLTGEVLTFNRLVDLADHLGIQPSTLSVWLDKPGQPVLPGLIQVKLGKDAEPWRKVKDPYQELELTFPMYRPIMVVNIKDGSTKVYERQIDCCKDTGIKPALLNFRLKSGNKPCPDGQIYRYYNTESA